MNAAIGYRPSGPVIVWWLAFALFAVNSPAQDVVITASASNPAARVKRTGQILDYTGTELKLHTTLGTDEKIPAARVIEIQTAWRPAHLAGRAARTAGKLDDAIKSLEQARLEERRPWAARQIGAELCGIHLEAGRIDRAGDEFLALVAADPATIHWDIVPIAWQAQVLDAASEARAAQWLADDKSPPARLLGASWLLAGSRRSECEATLKTLAESADRRIAALAKIQLWRTRLTTAGTGEVDDWSRQLEKMPEYVQAAGWFILGDAYARQNEAKRAAIAYLKPPLVLRQQRALAADALLAAAGQVEKLGQTDEAAGLYREILHDFPHLPPAKVVPERLRGK